MSDNMQIFQNRTGVFQDEEYKSKKIHNKDAEKAGSIICICATGFRCVNNQAVSN